MAMCILSAEDGVVGPVLSREMDSFEPTAKIHECLANTENKK